MYSQGNSLHFLVTIIIILVFSLSNCASEDSSSGSGSDTDNTTTSKDNSSSTSSDTTAPTVASVSPEDNSTNVAVSTTVAVTFSKTMSTSTITTNTDNTSCSGSFRLSSDNFTTCVKMSVAPSASNSDKTFTVTPDDNLSRATNYKIQINTTAADTSSNSLADNYTTSNGFTTYGSGTIRGTVRYDNNTAVDNVSVSFAKSGTTVGNTTTADNGTYSQDNLSLGVYTLTFTKSNYNDASLSATLATDNQSFTANVTLLADNCSAGTVGGTITDAVSGSAVSGVSLSVRSGLNMTSGSTTGTTVTTENNGTYTLSSMNTGGYTIEASKSGYITSYFNVNVCGNLTNQNTNISESLNSESMRIVVHWAANKGVRILDSHITGPDNGTGRFHVYWNASDAVGAWNKKDNFYYHINGYACTGCNPDPISFTAEQASDNVTLDRDDMDGAPGTETITVTKIRSGIYRYSVQNYSNSSGTRTGCSDRALADSGTTVTAYYNNNEIPFSPPNSAGNLWVVFTFNGETGVFTAQNTMTCHTDYDTIP